MQIYTNVLPRDMLRNNIPLSPPGGGAKKKSHKRVYTNYLLFI